MRKAWATDPHSGTDHRCDRGAGTLEHVGVVVLIGSIVAAILALPLAPGLSQSVRVAVCRVIGADCAPAPNDRPKPQCLVASRDRTVGASVTAFDVKVGHDDKVSIAQMGDGKTTVTLLDTYSVGGSAVGGVKLDLAALSKQLQAKGYAEAGIDAKGSYRLIYTFDTRQEADAWVERHRGVLDHITNATLGVLGDGLEQGAQWISRKLGFGSEDNRAPDAVGVDLGIQATLGGGYGMSTLAGVSGESKGNLTGSVVFNKDGTASFTGTADVQASGTGSLAFVSAKLGIGGKVEYKVTFDDRGNPVTLQLSGEYSGTGTLDNVKKGLPISPTGKVSYGLNGEQGRRYTQSYTLDLRNPANRAAFDQAFVTAGPVALPRVPPPGVVGVPEQATFPDFAPLLDRIDRDAVQVVAAYATDGYGGTIGGAGEGFGVEGTYKGTSARLLEAQSRDLGVASSALAVMEGCR